MNRFRTKWVAAAAVAVTAVGVGVAVVLPGAGQAESHDPDAGIICTESGSDSFVLTAHDGTISQPDGNTVYMWSYSAGSSAFQYPGPVLCVTAGPDDQPQKEITITLRNQLSVPTSVMFEGVEGVRANGAPASVEVDGSGRITSLVQSAVAGGSITYTIPMPPPGTYLYQSGTDHELQREMGLHGALVVRPSNFDNSSGQLRTVYGTSSSNYDAHQEYLHLFSQVDPSIHLAVEQGRSPDFSAYRPRYFMINGRAFPDTIAPNEAPWLPSQPYGSLVHVKAIGEGQQLPSIIRYVNAGSVNVPFHPHSNHEEVLGIDARPLVGGDGTTEVVASLDRFAVDVQAGQTMDARFSWTNTTWGGNTPSNPIPDQRNLLDGGYWSGDWRLGGEGVKPTGGDAFNICGEYYHVAHNHALFAATNYGAAMGGQLTLVRIDPDTGC